ncbi:hypothetical protein V6N13_070595 [Hibiscus sabdariffa]
MLDMDLTQDNTKANLLDMFLAGIDTTASTEEWLISELLKHPEAMKKLQQELADGEIAENLDMSEEYGLAITRKTPLHVLPVLYSHKDCVKNET